MFIAVLIHLFLCLLCNGSVALIAGIPSYDIIKTNPSYWYTKFDLTWFTLNPLQKPSHGFWQSPFALPGLYFLLIPWGFLLAGTLQKLCQKGPSGECCLYWETKYCILHEWKERTYRKNLRLTTEFCGTGLAVVVICPPGKCDLGSSKTPVAETPQASLFPNPHHNARAGHHSTLQRRVRSLFARGFFFLVSICIMFWICSNLCIWRCANLVSLRRHSDSCPFSGSDGSETPFLITSIDTRRVACADFYSSFIGSGVIETSKIKTDRA